MGVLHVFNGKFEVFSFGGVLNVKANKYSVF